MLWTLQKIVLPPPPNPKLVPTALELIKSNMFHVVYFQLFFTAICYQQHTVFVLIFRMVKVSGHPVQTFCIEIDSCMDAI